MNLSEEFWDNRYKTHDTGWDIGHVSTPLKTYIDQLQNKALKILIPGAGNAYEAEYLLRDGFQNVHVVDLSSTALSNLKARVPEFPEEQLYHTNFFDLNETFDLILEQTFFCAINPDLRMAYSEKMVELLETNGKLVGLLFNDTLNTDRPPFGGSKKEYLFYFEPYFYIDVFQECYNSIESRAGRELFIKLLKK
ncbi:SAM-dependent methyltransferase [Hanstruepera neustonica]|uniref:SAM-dependent methyltransferase n=1 Tax=Hanstruepera neustonica TaxID=1445657 RepID=A0A2K1E5A7_9FLAO|nr:methyltransferase domain-containing protein [Hanstruepera neustonica]PNQ75467.1 SAM-dependent methyltransferase [Hanstruepera neustonica]